MFTNYEKCKNSSVIKDIGHLKVKRADISIYSRFALSKQYNFF